MIYTETYDELVNLFEYEGESSEQFADLAENLRALAADKLTKSQKWNLADWLRYVMNNFCVPFNHLYQTIEVQLWLDEQLGDSDRFHDNDEIPAETATEAAFKRGFDYALKLVSEGKKPENISPLNLRKIAFVENE